MEGVTGTPAPVIGIVSTLVLIEGVADPIPLVI
jgi:hypothetical protein